MSNTTFLQEPEPLDREQSIEAYLKPRLQSLDRAVAGYTSVSLQGLTGNVDLTPTQAKHRIVKLTGAPAGAVSLRVPYATGANADIIFVNTCTGSGSTVTLKSTGANAGNGPGVSLAAGKTRHVRHDGESVYPVAPEQATVPSTLSSSLVAFWRLDEVAGVRVDSAGTSHLTDNNTVTQNAGKVGAAAQFTAASSEYLSVADNAALSMGNIEFTVSAWVYLDSKTATRTILSKRVGVGTGGEYSLVYDNSSDRFLFAVFDSTTGINIATANTFGSPSTATWYFIVGKVEAGTLKVSVNGGAFDSVAKTVTIPDTAAPFLIGAQQSVPTLFFDGRIDAVGIWKRALTSAEVTELYNAGAGKEYPF